MEFFSIYTISFNQPDKTLKAVRVIAKVSNPSKQSCFSPPYALGKSLKQSPNLFSPCSPGFTQALSFSHYFHLKRL